jgi:hypothetical protein
VGGRIRLRSGVGFGSWVGLRWGGFGLGEIFGVELLNFLEEMDKGWLCDGKKLGKSSRVEK